jgi:hypothetical protein
MTVPNMPGRRKAMPKPFKRKSITVSPGPSEKREWGPLKARLVQAGDTIAGHGIVLSMEYLNRAGQVKIVAGAPESHELICLTDDELTVFARVR